MKRAEILKSPGSPGQKGIHIFSTCFLRDLRRKTGSRAKKHEQRPSHGVTVTQSCSTLCPHGLEPARLLCPWNSPGKNIGVGYHFLLQQIFPTQGWNMGLLHCRQILYHLSHQGSLLLRDISKYKDKSIKKYLQKTCLTLSYNLQIIY